MFINPGLRYSHVLIFHKTVENQYRLSIFDSNNFTQSFTIEKEDLKTLEVIKNPQSPYDEMIKISDVTFRFDSFRYIESFIEKPLGYLKSIDFDGMSSAITLQNRGGYTGRAVFTIGFPDLNKNFNEIHQ